jgi:predicted O-methyltransferase YrrM
VSTGAPPLTARARAAAAACKGFLDEAEGQRLYELAYEHARLGPVVEIGSYCGKSSVYVGSGAKAGGGTLVCVDHHRGNEEQQPGWEYHDPDLMDAEAGAMDSLRFLRRTLRQADLEDTTVVMVTTSRTASALCPGPFGMVFIDGGHTFEAAETDLACWADKVAPGGILAIHDLFPDPASGGQAPITIYRRALASGRFDELPTTKTLGVLRRRG